MVSLWLSQEDGIIAVGDLVQEHDHKQHKNAVFGRTTQDLLAKEPQKQWQKDVGWISFSCASIE